MSIDKSGEWWRGSEPADLAEYLEAYSSEGFESHEFRLSQCTCGSIQFVLEADDDEGAARRVCAKCKLPHFICDSEEFWQDAEPDTWRCIECNGNEANIGIGFSLYPDSGDVKWLYVGTRCTKCAILGCFAGWKVGYGPSYHLLDLA